MRRTFVSTGSTGSPKAIEAAPVVAEPLPGADDIGRLGRRERFDARPALEPCEVAGHDALDLRLLQHHLRDEDRVRVARPPPGQVAGFPVEPGQQRGVHGPTLVANLPWGQRG
jgi:hypothetical protein